MAEAEPVSFAALLRQYRRAAGLSQELLAERAGVSARAVSDLERGLYRAPRRDTVDLLSRALRLTPIQRGRLEESIDRRRALPATPTPEPAGGVEAGIAGARTTGDAPAAPVPSAPAGGGAGGLPAPLTPLIGREADALTLYALLTDGAVRLVTLTGPAGVGKTRLALHVAAEVRQRFPDGVVFVPLDAVAEADLVLAAVARATGTPTGPAGPLDLAVAEALQPRRLLLVLDNFEQVLPAASQVAALLSGCPGVTVLVTSRAALRVRGEHLYPVAPLDEPAAVRLFLERAREAVPDLRPAAGEQQAIGDICRRLDGLPLAIELAAARTRLLGPAGVLTRLADPLALLTGGPRDLPQRHQALRAAVAWSYDLLTADEQAVFRRLSVFAGGCAIEAATAVCAPRGLPALATDPLDALAALVDHSLVRRETAAGAPRLRLLETLREFGAERLNAAGEGRATQRSHARFFLTLAERAARELIGPTLELWLDRLQEEHDNLRRALRWAVDGGETAVALRLGAALGRFWSLRGHFSEGWRWLEEALALPVPATLPLAVRARAINVAGTLAQAANEFRRADALFEESLAAARASGDPQLIADALISAGGAARAGGDHDRAVALFEEALARPDLTEAPRSVARALFNLGMVARDRHELDRAATLLRRCHDLQTVLGDRQGQAVTLNVLASVLAAGGEHQRARELHEEGLAIQEALGHKRGIAVSLGFMCVEAVAAGDRRGAAAVCSRALVACRDTGQRWNAAQCLAALAGTAWEDRQPEGAARLLGAADRLRQGSRASLAGRPGEAQLVERVRASLGDDRFRACWGNGNSLTLDGAVELGLAAVHASA